MADREDPARIRAFVEQHRHTYDQDALRRTLLAAGYDPQVVAVALEHVDVVPVCPPAPQTPGKRLRYQVANSWCCHHAAPQFRRSAAVALPQGVYAMLPRSDTKSERRS